MTSLLLKRLQTQLSDHSGDGILQCGLVAVNKADLNAALRAWQDAEARADRNAKELAKVKHDARLSEIR